MVGGHVLAEERKLRVRRAEALGPAVLEAEVRRGLRHRLVFLLGDAAVEGRRLQRLVRRRELAHDRHGDLVRQLRRQPRQVLDRLVGMAGKDEDSHNQAGTSYSRSARISRTSSPRPLDRGARGLDVTGHAAGGEGGGEVGVGG